MKLTGKEIWMYKVLFVGYKNNLLKRNWEMYLSKKRNWEMSKFILEGSFKKATIKRIWEKE